MAIVALLPIVIILPPMLELHERELQLAMVVPFVRVVVLRAHEVLPSGYHRREHSVRPSPAYVELLALLRLLLLLVGLLEQRELL